MIRAEIRPAPALAEVAVCIVNWNTRELLNDCVSHLLAEDESRPVWVLDNGPT